LLQEDKELDNRIDPLKTFQILDADSSQQQAILEVKKGKNLVIEGPPGTGKSQTIANIIAESLVENKKVLFVSQKMAALEVVKKRLDNNGLGDFCLELHSRKANKAVFVKELARVLEMQKKQDHSHDDELAKVVKLKKELNGYVRDIHTPYGKLEMTPYQAMGIISSSPDLNDISFIFEDSQEWDRSKFNACCDLLDNLSHNLSIVGEPKEHPWYYSEIKDFGYKDKLEIADLLNVIIETHLGVQNYSESLAANSCIKEPSSITEIEVMIGASNILAEAPKALKATLENEHWNSLSADIVDIVNTVKAFNIFNNQMKSKYYVDNIFSDNIDIVTLIREYSRCENNRLLLFTPTFWKCRNTLKGYIVDKKYKANLKTIVSELNSLNQGKILLEKIENINNSGKELFGALWKGKGSSWEELDTFSKWIVRFRYYVVKKYFKNEIFEKLSEEKINKENTKRISSILQSSVSKLKDTLDLLFRNIKLDEKKTFQTNYSEMPLISIINKIAYMKDNIDMLEEWARYQEILVECENAGLGIFINKVASLEIPYNRITDVFRCQLLRCWLDRVFSDRVSLKRFRGEDHEKLIQKFCELDKKQIELAKIRLQHNLSGKFDTEYALSCKNKESELAILLRESRKTRAHMPIRKLFEKIPRAIISLKPCLLMSPITAAQFLNPKNIKFDIVIFDEASQIPPEDSLGSIMRGEQVVIAGDSNQLPPTSFFQSEVITSEDVESAEREESLDDLDSILEECSVSGMSKTMLRWHYRSKHESLIAFSNRNFYDNHLFTFPNAEDETPHLGVKFKFVPNTSYDRGGTGTNVEEAREVSRAVFKHFREYPELSIGVGTFSVRQKEAIDDSIEQMLREDSSMEPFFAKDRYESFFVKNLETIQGDERDVIFISVGYGKDAKGKLSMNFGPINQIGGPRRLNVLVSRARRRTEIFSSIRGDDFDLSRTDKRGVMLLKNYLDYAEKGKSYLISGVDSEGLPESPFEKSVYDALIPKGIIVRKQVGCSGYRIDLGVVDKDSPGRYILGIECDGAQYHSSLTARDRDRLRQQVLEDLNWNIYRIWSTDWFKNPRHELEKLLDVIEKAQRKEFKKKINETTNFNIQLELPLQYSRPEKDSLINYAKAEIEQEYTPREFYNTAEYKIALILKKIVNLESPIHKEEAWRKAVGHWDISSLGSRIRATMEIVEQYCIQNDLFKKKGDFYWSINMKNPVARKRDPEDLNKGIEYISIEEIGEAALFVLKKEFSAPKDDLVDQTARILGFNRVTEQSYKYISKAIESYVRKNKIIKNDGRLIPAEKNG
jgi:very-short-patch-repair endonuclease/DNA polymerase III delta prime subunit